MTTQPTKPTEFIINSQLAQAVLNYLATRPYAEVWEMIAQITQLQPVTTPEQEKPS